MSLNTSLKSQGLKVFFLCNEIASSSSSPLTTVYLVWLISTVCLVVAHQVGLDAVAAATHKVCGCGTPERLRSIWNTHTHTHREGAEWEEQRRYHRPFHLFLGLTHSGRKQSRPFHSDESDQQLQYDEQLCLIKTRPPCSPNCKQKQTEVCRPSCSSERTEWAQVEQTST